MYIYEYPIYLLGSIVIGTVIGLTIRFLERIEEKRKNRTRRDNT